MSAFAAGTYYISASTGSDSNTSAQAKSKNTPWAHLPGMASCVSNCASYTPAAGDVFILKGCDVWVNSDLPVSWDWSGTSTNPITVTVDKNWYNTNNCPSAWNRPVFDGQKSSSLFVSFSINATRSYIVFDNIEMKRGSGNSLRYVSCYNACGYTTVQNLYIHAWNVVTDGSCVLAAFYGVGNLVQTSVFDGSDATGANPPGATCYAAYAGLPDMKNNVIHDVANGIVGYAAGGAKTVEIGGNHIYNIKESNAGSHPNAIEIVSGGTYYIHDNVIHDALGEQLMFGNTGEIDYIWNNVIYNILGNTPESPQVPGQSNMSFSAWNNTIVTSDSQTCIKWNSGDGGSFNSVTIKNTHCVTAGGAAVSSNWNGTPANLATNLAMTPSVATEQGYTKNETYAYSPVSASNSTVGTGTNLTNNCSGSTSGLCSDTAYACSYNSTNQTISCPARISITRPPSGAWDVGAYEYTNGSNDPDPPSNLEAMPQ